MAQFANEKFQGELLLDIKTLDTSNFLQRTSSLNHQYTFNKKLVLIRIRKLMNIKELHKSSNKKYIKVLKTNSPSAKHLLQSIRAKHNITCKKQNIINKHKIIPKRKTKKH